MKTIKPYYRYIRSVAGIMFVTFSACNSKSQDSEPFTILVNSVEFNCHLAQKNGDTIRLEPIMMYLDVEVTNNTNEVRPFGAYNGRFAPGNKKYGYFELLHDQDTIELYSNYSEQYEFQPGQSIGFQLSYENRPLFGYNEFLNLFSIEWIDEKTVAKKSCPEHIPAVQRMIENFKIIYHPCNNEPPVNTGFKTAFSSDLFVDYVYDDNEVFEMQRKDSKWKCAKFGKSE